MTLVSINREAGLGSIFLQALDWLWYSEHTKIPLYVYWPYGGKNMFDLFFDQKQSAPTADYKIVRVNYHSTEFNSEEEDKRRDAEINIYTKYKTTSCFLCCNPFVYQDPEFVKFRTVLNGVMGKHWTPKFSDSSIPENTLGVHLRRRDHYTVDGNSQPMSDIISLEEYYKQNIAEIQQEFETGNYDNIYIACHMKPYFDKVLNVFKDKALFLDFERWGEEIRDSNFCTPQSYTEALQDKVNLSKCKYLIGNVSNFTMMTLILNPNLPFKIFGTVKNCYGM